MAKKASGRIVCYRLQATQPGERELSLPEKAAVLSAGYLNGAVGLWVLVPADLTGRETMTPRRFLVLETGGKLEGDRPVTYLGTAVAPSATFTVHVFEIDDEEEESEAAE